MDKYVVIRMCLLMWNGRLEGWKIGKMALRLRSVTKNGMLERWEAGMMEGWNDGRLEE